MYTFQSVTPQPAHRLFLFTLRSSKAGNGIVKVLALLAVLIVSTLPRSAVAKDKPSFRADLKQFGYVESNGPAEYSTLGFLSDDLLLIAVNQRLFHVLIQSKPLTSRLRWWLCSI